MIPFSMELSILLTAAGIVALGYSQYLAKDLRETLSHGSVKEAWDLLSFLFNVFIVGYTGYLLAIVKEVQLVNVHVLTASVFFLGSLFAVITVYTNRKAFSI